MNEKALTRLITVNNTDPNDKLNSSLSVLSQSVLTLILLEGVLLYHMSEILCIVVSAIYNPNPVGRVVSVMFSYS